MKMHSEAWMTSAKQPLQLFGKTSWHTQRRLDTGVAQPFVKHFHEKLMQ